MLDLLVIAVTAPRGEQNLTADPKPPMPSSGRDTVSLVLTEGPSAAWQLSELARWTRLALLGSSVAQVRPSSLCPPLPGPWAPGA